ncbi:MAG: hypothetical protein HYV34_03550 [Candidatus Kerfeldbacteria bacterium]|nr:hypothetical protein [Candidatus Kerfeldbacteria bacterium]
MKTRFPSLAIAVLGVLAVAGFASAQTAWAETIVDSGITADTTWTLDGSPYRVVIPNVVVFQDVTLTIDPGVQVIFDGIDTLDIRGHLNAIGTDPAPITFTPSAENPDQTWQGISVNTNLGGSLNLQHTELSSAKIAVFTTCCNSGGPLSIQDSVFRNNTKALAGYSGSTLLVVKRSLFENNHIAVTGGDKNIYDSTFTNNEYGLYQTERINVFHSTFTGNTSAAVYGGRGVVENSLIENNGTGIQGFYEGFTVSQSTIRNNDVGVIMTEYGAYRPPITYNTITGNTVWNVQVIGPSNAHLENNWWGATDENAILDTIEDGRDNGISGLALIDPFQLRPFNVELAPRVRGNTTLSVPAVLGEPFALLRREVLR